MAALSRPLNVLFAALWAVALIRIFVPLPWLMPVGAVCAAAYATLAFVTARRQVQVLFIAMGAAALALAWWTDGWAALPHAGETVSRFVAFFGTLALLRATADARPEIASARALVARLRPVERVGGLTVGAHLLGAVLNHSVMAIFAPIVGRDASPETRLAAAEACQRGMCLACLWSPFWVAMAFCYQYLPNVPLWQIMALGLVEVALGLVLAQAMYARGAGLGGLWRALKGFLPVVPPLALAAGVVLTLTAVTPLSALEALVLGVPVLCVAGLFAQGADRLRAALVQTRRGMGAVSSELVLLSAALALGHVLEGPLSGETVNDAVVRLAPPAWAVIAAVVGGMTVLALAGVHQIVGATVMLAVFGKLALGVSDMILMEAVLLGWAFASMCGLSAISVAAAGTMFGVRLEAVAYGANLRFLAVYGTASTALLVAINAAL